MKIKILSTRILYPVKRNFKIESKTHFHIRATDFIDKGPAPQEMLKSVLPAKGTPEENACIGTSKEHQKS